MKPRVTFVAIALLVVPVAADTCLAPKNPVKAAVVCGRVTASDGEFVPDIELQLVRGEQVVAKVWTNSVGDFMFGSVPEGDYNLTTKAQGWHLYSAIRVISDKKRRTCPDPLRVRVSLGSCGSGISKRGYHAKF